MSRIDPEERVTQAAVIRLFTQELGYSYLGNLKHETDNSNIREDDLRAFLEEGGWSWAKKREGQTDPFIGKAPDNHSHKLDRKTEKISGERRIRQLQEGFFE